MTGPRLDVVVVGGGQAGLAIGRELAARRFTFVILDAAPAPGTSWRARWDSLRLFTPAAYSALPGLAFPASPDALPTKDQVADYLAAYQADLDLPVRWRTPVERLGLLGTQPGDGYVLQTPGSVFTAAQVVVATGPFQRPWRPPVAEGLCDAVHQVHSGDYRNPGQLPDGPVLVVGGGNSGVQIADELSRTRPTTLAVGSRLPVLPARVAGRSVFWWLDHLGLLRIPAGGALGRRARATGDILIGTSPRRLRRLALTGRIVAAEGGTLRAADGSPHRPRSVVWATGYRPDHSWVRLPVVADDGSLRQRHGRTELPGLYTLGVPWQRTSSSALLGGVGHDVADLIMDITRRRARGTGG